MTTRRRLPDALRGAAGVLTAILIGASVALALIAVLIILGFIPTTR